jgi:hypothetical protein
MSVEFYQNIANEVNHANGTVYYYFNPGARDISAHQFTITGTVTITIEATVYPKAARDGIRAAVTGDYVDITSDIFNGTRTSLTAADSTFIINDVANKYSGFGSVRYKVVFAGGGTDDLEIVSKVSIIR